VKVLNLLARAWTEPAKSPRIDSVEQLLESFDQATTRRSVRFEVPMNLTSTEGAFALAGGWHPFVAAIGGDADVLAKFYHRFQPKSLGDLYSLSDPDVRRLGPRQLPWLQPPRDYRGEKGLGPEHGISLFGPCSQAKIALEHARLTQIVASIAADGYLPDRFGDITGYVLVRRNEFRFLVRGGKHRAAALAALGWSYLPVRFKPGWVRAVLPERLNEWPMVRAGRIAAAPARQIFERYFEWNGTQQQRRIIAP
jgi:hypothetical protein